MGLYRQPLNAPDSPGALAAGLRARAEALGFAPVGLAAVPGGPRLPLRSACVWWSVLSMMVCRCGRDGHCPGANVADPIPVQAQMRQGGGPVLL